MIPLRIGLVGLLGQGNLGNDASLEVMLNHLSSSQPGATVELLCSGPDEIARRFGHGTTQLHWNNHEYETAGSAGSVAAKALGKLVDIIRIAAWVRRQDVVIIPGMGVLESNLPLRPWGLPYSLFVVCVAGRIFSASIALVSVGADRITSPTTRWLITGAARLAAYRSYRDEHSRHALASMGIDTSRDMVRSDLVFAMPNPAPVASCEPNGVALGIMDYRGGNDDRATADRVHARYVDDITRFALWLVDQGHPVRVVTSDRDDEDLARRLVAAVRASRPDRALEAITTEPSTTLAELMDQLVQVETVVATRYHTVLSALKLAKPTVSLGYGIKNDVLMASMGLGEFCQPIRGFDVDRLIEHFRAVRSRRDELVPRMRAQATTNAQQLAEQFAVLSTTVMRSPPRAARSPRAPIT